MGVVGACVVLAVLVLCFGVSARLRPLSLPVFDSVLGVFVYENVTINGIYKGDGKQDFGDTGSGQMDAEKSAKNL